MTFKHMSLGLCAIVFCCQQGLASPLEDAALADQALALIGARVPDSTLKCAGCHNLNAVALRSWIHDTSRVSSRCLEPWSSVPTAASAQEALGCLSLNGVAPFQWSGNHLGLWTGRVNSQDFVELFTAHYGAEHQNELNRFRERTYMPRSGAPGFSDREWLLVDEYVKRGAPLLEEKLAGRDEPIPPAEASVAEVVVLDNLQSPWAIVPSPEGQIWITEKQGQVKIFDAELRLLKTLGDLPDLRAVGQGGLLDLAFHPRFSANGWVYLAYTVQKNGGHNTQINRFTYRDGRLKERKIVLDGPSGTDGAHFGCRLVFDDAGFLYAAFGERHQKEKAQSLESLHGKTVRLTESGDVPSDNPFGATNVIFTLGHRNPQGLDIHPVTRRLVVSEHGPTGYDAPGGGDEINILQAGGNYGWPVIHHRMTREGMESPLQEYTPAIAPSGIVFYTGDRIPQWKNNLFVTALAGAALYRLRIDGNKRLIEEEKLLAGRYGRLRDVANGPDGTLLVISDRGKLIQLKPR